MEPPTDQAGRPMSSTMLGVTKTRKQKEALRHMAVICMSDLSLVETIECSLRMRRTLSSARTMKMLHRRMMANGSALMRLYANQQLSSSVRN